MTVTGDDRYLVGGLVRGLEGLYEQMWRAHEQRELPRPDLRNLEAYFDVACQTHPEAFELQTLADYRGYWLEKLARRHQGVRYAEFSGAEREFRPALLERFKAELRFDFGEFAGDFAGIVCAIS